MEGGFGVLMTMTEKQLASWEHTIMELNKRRDNDVLVLPGEFRKLCNKLGWGFIQYIKDSWYTWTESGEDIDSFCLYLGVEKDWVIKNCKTP